MKLFSKSKIDIMFTFYVLKKVVDKNSSFFIRTKYFSLATNIRQINDRELNGTEQIYLISIIIE